MFGHIGPSDVSILLQGENNMVHTFVALDCPIALDVNSGAVHVLDQMTYDVLRRV